MFMFTLVIYPNIKIEKNSVFSNPLKRSRKYPAPLTVFTIELFFRMPKAMQLLPFFS